MRRDNSYNVLSSMLGIGSQVPVKFLRADEKPTGSREVAVATEPTSPLVIQKPE